MKYDLKAVTYRDRLKISLAYIGVVGIMGVLVTLVLLFRGPGILERWPWVFVLLLCAMVALAAYRARGPDHSGFIEMTDAALTLELNGHVEVINFSTVSKAVCFDVFGNKTIILKKGTEWKEIVYSAYSIDLIHEFRRVLGPRLKEGWFEVMKTW